MTIKNLSAPAEGTISQAPPKEAEVTDPYGEPGSISGKYASFNYPAHYKKNPSKTTGSYLEVFDLSSTNYTSRHISVGILSGSLASDGSIAYRKSHPEIYKALPQTRYSIGFSSTTSGSEQTLYTEHDGRVAAVSVTSPGNADLSADALYVLTSLKWK